MGGSKIGVWLCLVVSLTAGCPPEEGPAEDGPSNANPADGGNSGAQNNGGNDEPGNTGDTGDDNSSDTGDDNDGNTADGNAAADAGGSGELDAGGSGELDAGTTGGVDAGTTGGIDASAGNGEDAASTNGGEDASLSADAGTSEPDAQVEEDAGPPVVVPDLGAADMSDADRVTLIVNYLQAEAYTSSWYPVLQSEAVQRPLIVSSPSTHGTTVRAFQNPVAKQALDAWVDGDLPLPLDMPNGSVMVKEAYKVDPMTQEVVLDRKLIMAKIDALDSTSYEGNWFYMSISSTNVAARGTTCVNCHNGRSAVGAWPKDPMNNPMGGRTNALVPYDYMFIPYCYDERTPECAGPNQSPGAK